MCLGGTGGRFGCIVVVCVGGTEGRFGWCDWKVKLLPMTGVEFHLLQRGIRPRNVYFGNLLCKTPPGRSKRRS